MQVSNFCVRGPVFLTLHANRGGDWLYTVMHHLYTYKRQQCNVLIAVVLVAQIDIRVAKVSYSVPIVPVP